MNNIKKNRPQPPKANTPPSLALPFKIIAEKQNRAC